MRSVARIPRFSAALLLAAGLIAVGGCGEEGAERAPAGSGVEAGGPEEQLAVEDVYLGVSCPGRGNYVGCDRVGVYVRTREATPDFILARVAGHRVQLRPRRPGDRSFEGFLRSEGLLHEGPLAVEANEKERWFGREVVRVPVEVQAGYEQKPAGPARTIRRVRLSAGYG